VALVERTFRRITADMLISTGIDPATPLDDLDWTPVDPTQLLRDITHLIRETDDDREAAVAFSKLGTADRRDIAAAAIREIAAAEQTREA
jgi:predicted RNA-binding Zn ribbon-like protein